MILFVLTIVATIRIHNIYPEKHDELSDFPRVITEGPYSICRHPFYAVLIVNQYSIALIGFSLEGLLMSTAMLPLWILLMQVEEKELLNQWDKEYERYMHRVPMLIPIKFHKMGKSHD